METVYDWLYRTYTCPVMSETDRRQAEILDRFIRILPAEKRVAAYDLITYLRFQWGLEAFTTGVELGMELFYAPKKDPDSGRDALLDFLAKLDQPVA